MYMYYGLRLTLVCAKIVKQIWIVFSKLVNHDLSVEFKSQNLMEYFCKYVCEFKIKKVEKSQALLQLLEIAREARENLWTIDGTLKVYMLKSG